MAILLNNETRVVIQGITGQVGSSYADRMKRYATPLVGGVTPGKAGQVVAGVPVFDSVRDAVVETGANISLIVVPAGLVADAAIEAIDAGIRFLIIYTEHVPVLNALQLVEYARLHHTIVIGPNAAGVAVPDIANVSDIDDRWLLPGRVGMVSRSGTMTYEVLDGLQQKGEGISSLVCVGGDLIIGTRTADVVEWFMADDETEVIVMLGEVGGTAELDVLERVDISRKPIVACIAGLSVPQGIPFGHVGAIVQGANDTASHKIRRLSAAGIQTVPLLTDVATVVMRQLQTIKS